MGKREKGIPSKVSIGDNLFFNYRNFPIPFEEKSLPPQLNFPVVY
jgi:hypothetical protein